LASLLEIYNKSTTYLQQYLARKTTNYLKKKSNPCQKISLQQIINIFTTIINMKTNKKLLSRRRDTGVEITTMILGGYGQGVAIAEPTCRRRGRSWMGSKAALAGTNRVGALAIAERLEVQSALAGGGCSCIGT
jgi:hypothetical protein